MLAEIGQRIRIIQWIDLRSQKKAFFSILVGVDFSIFLGGCKKGNIYRNPFRKPRSLPVDVPVDQFWEIILGRLQNYHSALFSLSWCFLILYSRLAGSGWIITHSIIMQNPQGKTNKQTEKSKQTNKQTTKQPNNLTIKQTVYTTTKCVFFFLKPNF